MKKFAIFAVVALIVGAFYVSQRNETIDIASYDADPDHLEWCESIYHRNVGCPKFGQVEVPAEVLAQEEADHLAWCESIYHQNVGCPKHGKVEIPPAVLAKQEADHLAWCDRIGHRNVGCPDYKR
jgi:demethoxyubiquinone hydroxylase (CLK1/Coq7/Cat5 family)